MCFVDLFCGGFFLCCFVVWLGIFACMFCLLCFVGFFFVLLCGFVGGGFLFVFVGGFWLLSVVGGVGCFFSFFFNTFFMALMWLLLGTLWLPSHFMALTNPYFLPCILYNVASLCTQVVLNYR